VGDEELAAFCQREYPRLVAAMRLMTGDPVVAEDLAQEALSRAVGAWPRVSRLESPGGWTHRVALNLATSRFRRLAAGRRAQRRLAASEPLVREAPAFLDAEPMWRAVAALPVRQRSAVVLRHALGWSVEEVADHLGCSTQAARNLTHRGLAALREQLQEQEAVDG
jgi:RNA polymerase sigma-70 factor (sigma-E family)